jgi:cytochrome c biogenesis protein CcmG/thiol:disulfide interchange protein DsbE
VKHPLVIRYYNGVSRTDLLTCPPKPLPTSCPTRLPTLLARLLVLGLLATLVGCYGNGRPPRIGSNAPDFTVQDSDHKVTLSQFRGQVVVLNFWATWCPPCVEETPSLVRMQARLKDKGVVVLAVSIDDDDAAYHRFLKEYGVNMVTVRDEARKAATLYGTFGWPETFVIDRQGVVRRKFIGPVEWTSPEVTDYLGRL